MAVKFASCAAVAAALALAAGLALAQQPSPGRGGRGGRGGKAEPTGFRDTPLIPGSQWHVHDDARPRPAVVEPAPEDRPGAPPSDAIALFDGKDLSHWAAVKSGDPPAWKADSGVLVVTPYSGDIRTVDAFGDCQLHLEWAAPAEVRGNSQSRGNSGVILMGKYRIAILDSYRNVSFADGQAGAIFGQYPPLVNASRKPGEWQSFDIVFEAPRFEDEKLVRPARVTLFQNGVLVQNRRPLQGPTVNKAIAHYTAHASELPLTLEDGHSPVRFRNIWIRPIDLGEPDLLVADLKAPAEAAAGVEAKIGAGAKREAK
jgi:hypothetical protein